VLVLQARKTLERRRVELEQERRSVEKIQRKFAVIHSTLTRQRVPDPL
jgi:hypothetical protein